MAYKRDRIIKNIEFLESCDIEVNVAKNNARGNKGFFSVKNDKFRIDISKIVDEDSILRVLAHEFAHFLHYKYDKTLKDLSFIFENVNDEVWEELISLTVDSIPQKMVEPLFSKKQDLKTEIDNLTKSISLKYVDFKRTTAYYPLEKLIKKTSLKYLLKHDRVKLFEGFKFNYYSIDDIDLNNDIGQYLKLKSLQRAQRRLNSKISKLNNYYNSPTELFARSFEFYLTDKEKLMEIAPNVFCLYEKAIKSNKIPLMNKFVELNTEILNI